MSRQICGRIPRSVILNWYAWEKSFLCIFQITYQKCSDRLGHSALQKYLVLNWLRGRPE